MHVLVLFADYHFLEDVLQCKDRARRKVAHDLGGLRPTQSRKRKLGETHDSGNSGSSSSQQQQPPHQMQQQDLSAYPKQLQKLVRAVSFVLLPQQQRNSQ